MTGAGVDLREGVDETEKQMSSGRVRLEVRIC